MIERAVRVVLADPAGIVTVRAGQESGIGIIVVPPSSQERIDMAKSDWVLLVAIAVLAAFESMRPVAIVLGVLWFGILAHNVTSAVTVLLRFEAAQHRAFSLKDLAIQERGVEKAARTVRTLFDDWTEKYGENAPQSPEETIASRRAWREAEYAQEEANREIRHLHMMIQANARVATGAELLTDAHSRVAETYRRSIDEALKAYLASDRANEEGLAT